MFTEPPDDTGVVFRKHLGHYTVHTHGRELDCTLSSLIHKQLIYSTADPTSMRTRVQAVREIATQEAAECVVICAQLESELVALPAEERLDYLQSLGVSTSGVDQLIKSAYHLLGLMSFLTAGEKEVRAWTIPQGTRAQTAAGTIHSDIERGFIRAEVISYPDLISAGSYAVAREKGLLRLEGKDYIMQEGDVVHFRFNV